MSERAMDLARDGFGPWQRGDFATIEAMLEPDVQWRWFEPDEWDCRSRDDVMRTLRERHEQGFAASELEFLDAGEDTVVVVAHPAAVGGEGWPEETATVIAFQRDKVTTMRDHRTKEEALAAAPQAAQQDNRSTSVVKDWAPSLSPPPWSGTVPTCWPGR